MTKKQVPETSREAFHSLDPIQLAEIYRKILWGLSQLGEATFEELAVAIKEPKERVWKRMSELRDKGLIYRPGNKRMLRSNRMGYTWMLTKEGLPTTSKAEKALSGKTVADYSKSIQDISKQLNLL